MRNVDRRARLKAAVRVPNACAVRDGDRENDAGRVVARLKKEECTRTLDVLWQDGGPGQATGLAVALTLHTHLANPVQLYIRLAVLESMVCT